MSVNIEAGPHVADQLRQGILDRISQAEADKLAAERRVAIALAELEAHDRLMKALAGELPTPPSTARAKRRNIADAVLEKLDRDPKTTDQLFTIFDGTIKRSLIQNALVRLHDAKKAVGDDSGMAMTWRRHPDLLPPASADA